MSQRKKILLVFTLTILIFAGSALVLSWGFFQYGLQIIEETELTEYGQRFLNLLQNDLEQLDRTTTDWAYWDDTWEYMAGLRKDYEGANFSISTFQNLGLAALYYFQVDGSIRYYYTMDGHKSSAFEQLGHIEPMNLMAEGQQGILRAGDKLYLVSGRAILHNDGYGPAMGSLWMAWPLGERQFVRYSKLLGLTIKLMPEGQKTPAAGFERKQDYITMTMDLKDLYGNQAGTIGIQRERTMYRYGAVVIRNFSLALLIALVLISVVLYVILRKQFLDPLKELQAQLVYRREHPDEPIVLQGITHDEIDELIAAFNRLTEQLVTKIEEREKLLHEIYHRVYNNLQIMASILQLQTYHSKNEETITAILQGRRRILVIAQIQRLLYEQDDINSIPLISCLDALINSFEPEEGPDIPIRLESDLSNLYDTNPTLSIEEAVPLTLIVSELLSNCYAHAFTGKSGGTIMVRAAVNQNSGMIQIEVIDDGLGILEPNQRGQGLGLELVQSLTAQIGGTFTISAQTGGGTKAVLQAPLELELPCS